MAMRMKLGMTSLVWLLNAPVMEPGLTNHLPPSVRMWYLVIRSKVSQCHYIAKSQETHWCEWPVINMSTFICAIRYIHEQ